MSANFDERILDDDPLTVRLRRATVPAPDRGLRAALLDGSLSAGARRPHRLRWAAVGALAFAFLIAVATPVGAMAERAVLPAWLQHRLGIVGAADRLPSGGRANASVRMATSPMPCSQATKLRVNALCYPDLSLVDAQRGIDFTIPVPAIVPNGLHFAGAIVQSPRDVRYVMRDESRQRALGLWVRDAAQSGGSAFPLFAAQTTYVSGTSAVYVHGSYEDSGPGTPARWNAAADDQELIWSRNGFTYDLTGHGLHLTQPAMVAIAESIR